MKVKALLIASLVLTSTLLFGQKIEMEEIEMEYIQLPLVPFTPEVKTYKIEIVNLHSESVRASSIDYQNEVDEEQEKVDSEHKAVKIINTINGTPTQAKFVEKPYLANVYKTHIHNKKLSLDYLKTTEAADITIELQISGFDYETKLYTSGSAEARKYSFKVTAKNEMTLIVKDAAGTVLSETFVTGTDSVLKRGTRSFSSSAALDNYWAKSKEDVLSPLDDKLGELNFKRANRELNNVHGKLELKKKLKVAVAQDKKQDYSSFTKAYELVFEGAMYYKSEEASAIEKFNQALALWEEDLKEADLENKKARINKKVTAALRYNCVLFYTWAHDYKKANLHYMKLKMLDVGKYKKQLKTLKDFIDDQEKRHLANQ